MQKPSSKPLFQGALHGEFLPSLAGTTKTSKRALKDSFTQCSEVIQKSEGRWEDQQSSANMPSLISTLGYPNPETVNMNKSPSLNAIGSTSSKEVIMTSHSHNLMMNHKHPSAQFSKKSNFTTNSPSPPADYENKNDNTPTSSL